MYLLIINKYVNSEKSIKMTEGQIAIIVGIVAIIVSALIVLIGYIYKRCTKRSERIKNLYDIVWKKSSRLKPYDILKERATEAGYGFQEYYFKRKIDDDIKQCIEQGESIIVLGNSLAGKTRAVYQILKSLQKSYSLIIPRVGDVTVNDFVIPRHIIRRKREIIFFDDLDKFLDKQNFEYLLEQFRKRNTIMIATCRCGPELIKVQKKLESKMGIFHKNMEIPVIDDETAKKVAKEAMVDLSQRFDGNIGSIFMKLDAMKKRYDELGSKEKGILRTIKKLYFCRIYEAREIFSIDRIRKTAKEFEEIEFKEHEWTELAKKLEDNKFIELRDKNKVWAEEAYLFYVVEDSKTDLKNIFELLNRMSNIFENDFDALFSIGYTASETECDYREKREYDKLSIAVYTKALSLININDSPIVYGMTQYNLGNAHWTLSEVEEKAANSKKAISAYKESLKIRTKSDFPMDYAMTQNNLGNAYSTLSEVEDKTVNSKNAINAYTESLKIYTKSNFPMQYAMTQNNLGTAYSTLSEVEDKAFNSKNAINAYTESLKIGTKSDFPMDYALTQNNIGNTYSILSEVVDKAVNSKNAINAYTESLKIYTKSDFPMQYAMTNYNLGLVYYFLIEDEKEKNYENAINAFDEALKIYTEKEFPEDYNRIINILDELKEICK